MGQKAKWEYFRAIYERYRRADRKTKRAILNEFCVNTGYHRKYAIRLLNGPPPGKQPRGASRPRRVGVGIVITRDPLHGSGQAELPHPALASGNDAHAA
jgi:hypothetical protein